MSIRKVRAIKIPIEVLVDEGVKDLLDDLTMLYPNKDELISKAIEALHEKRFGSIPNSQPELIPVPKVSATTDIASEKFDELLKYVKLISTQYQHTTAVDTTAKNEQKYIQLSHEANEKIITKIEELGVKFSKTVSTTSNEKTGQKTKTTEMSNEEILHLLKRIDQLESKISSAISQSSGFSPSRRSGMRDFGEPPKVGEIKKIDGAPPEQIERPLLDDVLNTVIVSVDRDKEEEEK